MLGWIDVETTGLEPEKHDLLEVGIVITDDELNYRASTSVVIRGDLSKMDPYVANMHSISGLSDEVPNGVRRYEGEQFLIGFLAKHEAVRLLWKNVPISGSSVHFDRAWLKVHMPDLETIFSHRNVDVSTLKELTGRWYPMLSAQRERPGAAAHRALLDLEQSINELRWYRQKFFRTREEMEAQCSG